MNHYPRHVGDFIRDTVGLSLAERGAYTALLDTYYASEKPIQYVERYRICGATSRSDKDAVDYVMQRYFTDMPDGWHQKRADEEIDLYREKSQKARDSINRRWDKRNTNVLRTNNERKPDVILASNQEPVTSKTLTPLSDSPPATSDVLPLPSQSGKPSKLRQEAIELLGFLNERTDRHFRPTDQTLKPIMARLKEGFTVGECRAVIARKRREWQGTDMSKFLRPDTLFNATKFAQYIGEVPPPESGVENG